MGIHNEFDLGVMCVMVSTLSMPHRTASHRLMHRE